MFLAWMSAAKVVGTDSDAITITADAQFGKSKIFKFINFSERKGSNAFEEK